MSNDTKKDIDTIIQEKLSNIPVTSDIVKEYFKEKYESLMDLATTVVETQNQEHIIYKKSTTSANNPLTKFFTNNTDSVEKCIEKFRDNLFSDSILCKELDSYVVWSESYFSYPFSTNVMLIKHSGESTYFTNEVKSLINIESPFTAIFTNGPFRMIVRTVFSNKMYDGLKENFKSIVTSNFRELTIYGSDCECEAINELKIKLNKNVKFINNHEIISLKELCIRVTNSFVSSIDINIKETIEALNQIFELPLSSEDVRMHGERIVSAVRFLMFQRKEEGLIFATNFLRTVGYKRSFSLWDLLEIDNEKDLEKVISAYSEAERTFIRAAIGLFKK
jgi:hypothetical protein